MSAIYRNKVLHLGNKKLHLEVMLIHPDGCFVNPKEQPIHTFVLLEFSKYLPEVEKRELFSLWTFCENHGPNYTHEDVLKVIKQSRYIHWKNHISPTEPFDILPYDEEKVYEMELYHPGSFWKNEALLPVGELEIELASNTWTEHLEEGMVYESA